ncbi:hypothetical protein JOF56_010536 [Kibdelosporangium banguiense]|uniref:Uncharacterized protein n=1 Tax=Kibdelosporangium banguiense TaxID=1365924 RepID=A0ABS4U0H7_9PSEU|nr:hypothetical protein [Kibdelosporangium banguiense]MBP2330151.1 hypothetical protein [Kibdelosporangium banguiense]
MAFGISVAAMAVVGVPQASAAPVGPLAAAQFGIWHKDQGDNGQCGFEYGDPKPHEWKDVGEWTTAMVVDTDSRPGGCELKFGLNNADGSLNGLVLSYWFIPGNTGQCGGTASNVPIPYFPFAFQYFFMDPIIVNSDNRVGGCELTLAISGRNDIALDVLWEFNGDGGQCPGADPRGSNQHRTIDSTQGLSVFFETDDRGGACFLSFRLRHK